MPVEQHGFHFSQEIVVPVQVTPACLHHADLGIREVMDGLEQKVRRGDEIRIEDRHEFPRRRLETFGQRPGLEPLAILAVVILDGKTECVVALAQRLCIRVRIVCGIVQHLNLE